MKKRAGEYIWKEYPARIRIFVELHFPQTPEPTEDIVLAILVKAVRKLPLYNPDYALSTWIYRIAHNHCIDLLRKARRRRLREVPPSEKEPIDQRNPGPEQQLIREETRHRIHLLLNQLTADQRQVLYLKTFEEMSIREIAEVMGKPEGTVKNLAWRGRQFIKKHWEET